MNLFSYLNYKDIKSGNFKHFFLFETYIGGKYRTCLTFLGLKLLKISRMLLGLGWQRCSWCGKYCGFQSVISKNGYRCTEHKNYSV